MEPLQPITQGALVAEVVKQENCTGGWEYERGGQLFETPGYLPTLEPAPAGGNGQQEAQKFKLRHYPHVERMNLNMRMGMRRFTRLTNAFSKKLDNHLHALALYFFHYNFCRQHKSLRVSPAQEAGVTDELLTMEHLCAIIDAANPPKKRAPYKKAAKSE